MNNGKVIFVFIIHILEQTKDKYSDVIELKSDQWVRLDQDAFEAVLVYMHTLDIHIGDDNVVDIMLVADFLGTPGR